MNYPNKSKTTYTKIISYANRGMDLEKIINITNEYYLDNNTAIIHKKPTPIGVVKTSIDRKKIEKAYFQSKSTLDYNGLYKGKYIDFDAKETKSKTSFPISNIHIHQLNHMYNVIKHGGISFLIISINDEYIYLPGESIKDYLNSTTKKSIDYKYIKENGYTLKLKSNLVLDYIQIIDKLYFKED